MASWVLSTETHLSGDRLGRRFRLYCGRIVADGMSWLSVLADWATYEAP